jgi:proteasome lid subunit RPN8/RPN11
MLNSLKCTGRRWWESWRQFWQRPASPARALPEPAPLPAAGLEPLERLVLTDGVCRTLFEEYYDHRQGKRGDEETGWILMGHRHGNEALALATLPAGAEREAGVAHVRFNSDAQALASRILRQEDKQLGILGVVHTHPGSLRHPSNGDYQGDSAWVKFLRGREGIFGIGTADGEASDHKNPLVAFQPKEHSQCYLGLRFTWYALAEADRAYRTLPLHLTIGPDLARPLHAVWGSIEAHANRLDRLCRRLTKIRFEVLEHDAEAQLHLVLPLDKENSIRVVLHEKRPEYCLVRKGEPLISEEHEPLVDRGVYLMLAELA